MSNYADSFAGWLDPPLAAGGGGVSDHGALTGLGDDDHTQYLLLLGRAGGQTAIGGTATGEDLTLQATSHAGGGYVNVDHPFRLRYTEGNAVAEQAAMRWEETFTTAGAYIGGMIANTADISYTNAFYIYSSVQDNSIHRAQISAGFAAFTLFNALCTVTNDGNNVNLVQQIILNDGGVHERNSSGTSTAVQHITVSGVPQIRATVSGAVMTWTAGACGLNWAPKWSTVAGSTVNMGTLAAVQVAQPTNALFQPTAGVENITNIYGLNFLAHTSVASGEIAVIRSVMTAASNRYFLRSTGNAQSALSGQLRFPVDLVGITFGAGDDVQQGWAGGGFWFMQFNGLANQLRISNPSANRFLFNNITGTGQFNFNCLKFSLGAQTGAVGNQKGVFVAGAETVTVGGEYSQFLLTQAANDTLNAAITLYAGWTINAPSPTVGTGSLTTGVALNVGGNPSTASVNRIGVRIISNPTGGSGINAALWVTAGSSRFDGRVDINRPIALGGGAPALLGTIGATGPTAAVQAQWVEIDINGVAHWIPAWT